MAGYTGRNTGWVIKQNRNDPRWGWTHWSTPLRSKPPKGWTSSADFSKNKPMESIVRHRIQAARVGDRIWAWQTDEAAFLGVLLVRRITPDRGGVLLHLQHAAVFKPPISRPEAMAFPDVAIAPPFKNPGRDYRLTISLLGNDNERRLASLREPDLGEELRTALFEGGPAIAPKGTAEREAAERQAKRDRARKKRLAKRSATE